VEPVVEVELRHLRAFVMVAECGNFTRAAEGLFMTQPALSRIIRQLEALVGTQLLERSTRHVALTHTGQEFLIDVRSALTSVDQAVSKVRGRASIRLGFSWLLPDPWAQNVVRSFEERASASVEFVSCPDPLEALRTALIDIAVLRGEPSIPAGDIRLIQLFSEDRIAVCSTASSLADEGRVSWDDIAGWPLVVNTMNGTTGPWSWPQGQGPERTVETTSFDEWIESVAANRGIGIVPEVAARRISHPTIKFIPIDNAPQIPVHIAFASRNAGALIRQFTESALEAAAIP
jgi:DNA-binding transcriptional LysR family regulator